MYIPGRQQNHRISKCSFNVLYYTIIPLYLTTIIWLSIYHLCQMNASLLKLKIKQYVSINLRMIYIIKSNECQSHVIWKKWMENKSSIAKKKWNLFVLVHLKNLMQGIFHGEIGQFYHFCKSTRQYLFKKKGFKELMDLLWINL